MIWEVWRNGGLKGPRVLALFLLMQLKILSKFSINWQKKLWPLSIKFWIDLDLLMPQDLYYVYSWSSSMVAFHQLSSAWYSWHFTILMTDHHSTASFSSWLSPTLSLVVYVVTRSFCKIRNSQICTYLLKKNGWINFHRPKKRRLMSLPCDPFGQDNCWKFVVVVFISHN